MVVVAYRRYSFTRGSYCKDLTGKTLVFWIGGRLWEEVAHGGSTQSILLYILSRHILIGHSFPKPFERIGD